MNFFNDMEKEQLVELYDYFEGLKAGNQRRKLNEENQELTEELLLFDIGVGAIDDVIKEMADNFILLFQYIYALDITEEELTSAIKEKLIRTLHRKEIKYYE